MSNIKSLKQFIESEKSVQEGAVKNVIKAVGKIPAVVAKAVANPLKSAADNISNGVNDKDITKSDSAKDKIKDFAAGKHKNNVPLSNVREEKMKSFKDYVFESDGRSTIAFILEGYDEYSTFQEDQLNEKIEGFDKGAEKISHKGTKEQLEDHVDKHFSKSSADQKKSVADARAYFKNTDLRTEEEKLHGEAYKKKKDEHNAHPDNKHNQMEDSIFEHPLKYSGNTIASTKKHQMAGKDYVIPHGDHKGKGAVIGGMRLTPGAANMGNGKMLRTCPAATKGCEGSGGDRRESGIHKGGICLAAEKGLDNTVGAKKDKLARTRALADPKHQKHGAALLASDLTSMHKKAEKEDSVAHLRQRDSSDIDLVSGIVKKHFGDHPSWKKDDKDPKAKAHMKMYGYSKYSKHNGADEKEEHITRSDTGPEYNSKGEAIAGNRERKHATIEHLKGGKETRAYMVMAAKRDSKTIKTDKDPVKDIHTVRYHKYDEHGNHIGHEDFDADRNHANGDLRQYDKQAVRNTHDEHGREKGAVTLTDISGGNTKDVASGEHAGKEANPMVHPLTHDHLTDDPDHPGKKIYHVDPPHLKKKKIIPIGVAK